MIKVSVEYTTLGPQVRMFDANERSVLPFGEGARRKGQCVYCKRSNPAGNGMCTGGTTMCETRVWMDSRELRGQP
jgi:hypothetical protein